LRNFDLMRETYLGEREHRRNAEGKARPTP
jgi:hypothetical protein